MANYFVPMSAPQVPRNAMLDFSGINNAIDTNRQNALLQQQFGLQQRAADRADQTLALQRQTTAADLRNSQLNYEKGLATLTGGVAQSALGLQDPAARAQVWKGIVGSHPEFATTLHSHGIDPNNADAGLNFLVNEARGYQNPLDVQAKQAAIDASRAETALKGQQQKLAQRQFEFTTDMFNRANRGGAAPAMPNVGDVDSGYRFKGGNPADPNSWEPAQ
jgi:hypothetical protein